MISMAHIFTMPCPALSCLALARTHSYPAVKALVRESDAVLRASDHLYSLTNALYTVDKKTDFPLIDDLRRATAVSQHHDGAACPRARVACLERSSWQRVLIGAACVFCIVFVLDTLTGITGTAKKHVMDSYWDYCVHGQTSAQTAIVDLFKLQLTRNNPSAAPELFFDANKLIQELGTHHTVAIHPYNSLAWRRTEYALPWRGHDVGMAWHGVRLGCNPSSGDICPAKKTTAPPMSCFCGSDVPMPPPPTRAATSW